METPVGPLAGGVSCGRTHRLARIERVRADFGCGEPATPQQALPLAAPFLVSCRGQGVLWRTPFGSMRKRNTESRHGGRKRPLGSARRFLGSGPERTGGAPPAACLPAAGSSPPRRSQTQTASRLTSLVRLGHHCLASGAGTGSRATSSPPSSPAPSGPARAGTCRPDAGDAGGSPRSPASGARRPAGKPGASPRGRG